MRASDGARARLLSLLAIGVLAGSIAAQGAGSHPEAAPTLVVDNTFVLDTLDPQRAFYPTAYIVDRAVYDTLFTYVRDELAHPVPLLVESWSSTSAKRFTFRLRKGRPLRRRRAADVRRCRSSRSDGSSTSKGNPSHILSGFKVSAKDKYTVVIESSTPAPQLPAILTVPSTGIVNSKLVESHGGTDAIDASTADKAENWFNSSASLGAGSGPYVLQSYSRTSQVTLRPNPDYWGAKRPAFKSIVLRNMSAPTQLLNVRRGSHEIALDVSSTRRRRCRETRTSTSRANPHLGSSTSSRTTTRRSRPSPQTRYFSRPCVTRSTTRRFVPSRDGVPSRLAESSRR